MELFIATFSLLASVGAVVYVWWTNNDTVKYVDAVIFSMIEDINNLEGKIKALEVKPAVRKTAVKKEVK
jgi:hypothetical protein